MNILAVVLLLLTAPLSALGLPSSPPESWSMAGRGLPVLAEGRVMPLESWARLLSFRITGRENDSRATTWLLELLAGFESSPVEPRFLVNDAAILRAEGLNFTDRRLYSLEELTPLLVPDRVSALGLRYLNDPTPLGKEGLRFARALESWLALAEPEQSGFRVFLARGAGLTPLQLASQTGRTEAQTQDLGLWLYWREQSQKGQWKEAEQTMALWSQRSQGELGLVNQVQLELLNNAVPWVFLLGLLALSGFTTRWWPSPSRNVGLQSLVLACLAVSTLWLVIRMVLTGRPPVTNLPSTFLFTGWLCLVVATVLVYRESGRGMAVLALISGAILPYFSGLFVGGGDPFVPPQAVLNTNFWLALHVSTVSGGYAAVLVSALLGHAYLWNSSRRGPGNLTPLWKALTASLVWGLSLTFVGTLLGGVWADQSWGRFWGWDPKENGALLIILWTALVLHLRATGWAQEWGTAFAAALGLSVLLFSWMGVNLLGQGFHSYGATTGKATLFFGLLALDALFLAMLAVRRVLR